MSRADEGQDVTARHDRDKAPREASRNRESLDLTDWWAYLVIGGIGLILGALVIDLVLGIDMQSCFLAASSQPSLSAFSGFYGAYGNRSEYSRHLARRLLPPAPPVRGDLDGGVEDDRVSRGRLGARVMRTEMGLATFNSEERRMQP